MANPAALLKPAQRTDHETPPGLFYTLFLEFGPFTLDAAAGHHNALCDHYFTEDEDGLSQDWGKASTIYIRGGLECKCSCHYSGVQVVVKGNPQHWNTSPPTPERGTASTHTAESVVESCPGWFKPGDDLIQWNGNGYVLRNGATPKQNEVKPPSAGRHRPTTIKGDSGLDSYTYGLQNSGNDAKWPGIDPAPIVENRTPNSGQIIFSPLAATSARELYLGTLSQAARDAISEKVVGHRLSGSPTQRDLPPSCVTCQECSPSTGVVWLNCPYGPAITHWVKKASQEALSGRATSVMLLPARTDTQWWHRWVMPFAVEICFLEGRVTFVGESNGSTFPSVVVVFGIPTGNGSPKVTRLKVPKEVKEVKVCR